LVWGIEGVRVTAESRLGPRVFERCSVISPAALGLAAMPGNVFVPGTASGLKRDSVVNATALVTLDKADFDPEAGHLPASLMDDVDRGLRRVLGL
jgi:mRNA interferase MazF